MSLEETVLELDLKKGRKYVLPAGCGSPVLDEGRIVKIAEIDLENNQILTENKVTIGPEDAKRLTSAHVLDLPLKFHVGYTLFIGTGKPAVERVTPVWIERVNDPLECVTVRDIDNPETHRVLTFIEARFLQPNEHRRQFQTSNMDMRPGVTG